MSAPRSASTTSKKIAATRLKPLWISGRIADMHLLEEPHRFAVALNAHGEAYDAGALTARGIGEAAAIGAADGVREQRGHGVRVRRRRGLRRVNGVAPVTPQLTG